MTAPPVGIRRFHPDDLHITLAFLGPVRPEAARRAWAALGSVPTAFSLGLGAVVPMGGRPYSALSVGIEAGSEVVAAAIGDARGRVLAAAGAPPDQRSPRPHLTVARPMRSANAEDRAAGLDWAARQSLVGTRVQVGEVALYTWSEDRRHRLFQRVCSRAR